MSVLNPRAYTYQYTFCESITSKGIGLNGVTPPPTPHITCIDFNTSSGDTVNCVNSKVRKWKMYTRLTRRPHVLTHSNTIIIFCCFPAVLEIKKPYQSRTRLPPELYRRNNYCCSVRKKSSDNSRTTQTTF